MKENGGAGKATIKTQKVNANKTKRIEFAQNTAIEKLQVHLTTDSPNIWIGDFEIK